MAGFKQQGLRYGTYYSGQTNTGLSKGKRIMVVGLIVAILIAVGLLASTLFSNNSSGTVTLLAARESTLLTLMNNSQKNIRSADLSTANSSARILLTSDVNALLKVSSGKLDNDTLKQVADTTSADKIKDALLRDKFDIVYQQLILQKIATLTAEAQTVKSKVSNSSSKAAVNQALVNLDSINKQFMALQLQ